MSNLDEEKLVAETKKVLAEKEKLEIEKREIEKRLNLPLYKSHFFAIYNSGNNNHWGCPR